MRHLSKNDYALFLKYGPRPYGQNGEEYKMGWAPCRAQFQSVQWNHVISSPPPKRSMRYPAKRGPRHPRARHRVIGKSTMCPQHGLPCWLEISRKAPVHAATKTGYSQLREGVLYEKLLEDAPLRGGRNWDELLLEFVGGREIENCFRPKVLIERPLLAGSIEVQYLSP